MSEQIRREFTLPYPISKVKTAVENACRTGSSQINDRNPVFNTYDISLVKMLNVLRTTVTLKQISENECSFELSAMPGPQLTKMPNVTTTMIEEFLKRVGDFASGRLILKVAPPITPGQARKNKIAAITGTLIGLAIVGLLAYFLYFRK
ncbi:MAG: hypothetical protein P4L51_24395 [Puia sp.]|jgi:hypothetical protein|nr:hypothetical protein [Puia sp.]